MFTVTVFNLWFTIVYYFVAQLGFFFGARSQTFSSSMSQNKEHFEKQYWKKKYAKKMCLTICNHNLFVGLYHKGVTGSDLKTIFPRYLKNSNKFTTTFYTKCITNQKTVYLIWRKRCWPLKLSTQKGLNSLFHSSFRSHPQLQIWFVDED